MCKRKNCNHNATEKKEETKEIDKDAAVISKKSKQIKPKSNLTIEVTESKIDTTMTTTTQVQPVKKIALKDVCNGRDCGEGKHIGAGKFLCPHNSLGKVRPDLIPLWHSNNKITIFDVRWNTNEKAWFICPDNPCGCHVSQISISSRIARAKSCAFCKGKETCVHNNLSVSRPDLIAEWHPDNGDITKFSLNSNKDAKWICPLNPCGCHIYNALICSRTRAKDPTNCPYCAESNGKPCKHNNLAVMRPDLVAEWHKDNKEITGFLINSNKPAKWCCPINPCGCHIYEMNISDRTNPDRLSNCPYCSHRRTCPHYNLEVLFPHLVPEWDPANGKMSDFSPQSHENVGWICKKQNTCGCHKWPAVINSRTRRIDPSGCPYCTNQQLCAHNNLQATYPHLIAQWHEDNPPMDTFAPCTHKEAKWKCPVNPCGCHIWITYIYVRTTMNCGCPFCSGRDVCPHFNLETQCPHLVSQWHPDNEKPMSFYSKLSNQKVYWICDVNSSHIWVAQIANRTANYETGCPHCSKAKGYSKGQIKWLQDVQLKENITIQHALCPEGEYKIDGVGKVDGYCLETNTVYEYHGIFWHGHPSYFHPEDINPLSKKTYGFLYQRTLTRDAKIVELGYNLVVKWEGVD